MGSETIRDVTIKVNIEAGDSSSMNAVADAIKAKFQDAFKNIDVSGIKSVVETIKEEFSGAVGGIEIGKSHREGIESVQAHTAAVREYHSAVSSGGSRPGVGMPGYGQNVRELAAKQAREYVEAMKAELGENAMSPIQWARTENRASGQAASRIKENDRESSAGSRANAAEEKRTAAIEARAQREADAAERAADRESAAEAKKTQKKEAEEQRRSEYQSRQEKSASSAQGQQTSELLSGVGRVASGAASIAAVSASGNGELEKLVKVIALIHGAQSIYGGAHSAASGAAGLVGATASGGPIAVAVAATVAAMGAAIGYQLLSWKEKDDVGYSLQKKAVTKKVGQFHEALHNSQREFQEQHRRALGMLPRKIADSMDDASVASKGRRSDFANMRKDFEGWSTSSETMEQFQTRHDRQSQKTEFGIRQRESDTAFSTLQIRKDMLLESETKLENANKTIEEKGREVRETIGAQFKEIEKNPDYGWGKDENGKTVGIHSQKQKDAMVELGSRAADEQKQEQESLRANAEALVKIKEDELRIDQDIVKTLDEQNKSVAQYKQEAHDVVRKEVAKDKAHALSLGISDVGTMWERKRLDEKHQRIEAQKAKNRAEGKDENEGVEQYTQYELQQTQQFGDRSAKTGREQGLRQGLEWGIPRDEAEMTKEAKDEADRRDKKTEGIEDTNEGMIDTSAKDTRGKNGSALLKAMDDAMKENEVFEELIKKIEDWKAQMEIYKLKAGQLT